MIIMILRKGSQGWSQGRVASSSIFGNHCGAISDAAKGRASCKDEAEPGKGCEPLKREGTPLRCVFIVSDLGKKKCLSLYSNERV